MLRSSWGRLTKKERGVVRSLERHDERGLEFKGFRIVEQAVSKRRAHRGTTFSSGKMLASCTSLC